MKLCSKCILPETFPSIKFDADGVCNYCRSYKGHDHAAAVKAQYREKFESLLNGLGLFPQPSPLNPESSSSAPDPSSRPCTLTPVPSYHVLMAYSGGKDSTYTMDIFKNRYRLNVLALTFDHGFMSPFALSNIKAACERLGIDHLTFQPRLDVLKKVFTASIEENLYSKKSLERASTICSTCMGIVKSITLKLALEKNIPFIGYGWSPGQAPVQSSVMKINADFFRSAQKSFYEPLHKIAGDAVNPYFLDESLLDKLANGNYYNVHPLAFLDYSEEAIFNRIRELGWQPPQDTDSNSSNCLLNSFANQTHIDAYGFHPYAFEIAGLVRGGVMSREEGLEKIEAPQNEEVIRRVKQKLGIRGQGTGKREGTAFRGEGSGETQEGATGFRAQ